MNINNLKKIKEIIEEVNKNDINMTKVFITYKILLYKYNNEINLSDSELIDAVELIYEQTNSNDEIDLLISENFDNY